MSHLLIPCHGDITLERPKRHFPSNLGFANSLHRISGYVALAVASEGGTFTKEIDTKLGGERERNMVAFAQEALQLMKEVLRGDAKL